MSKFGKLNFSVAFNPQTAFPLDARYYFDSYEAALQEASKADVVGSTTATYFYGQNIAVVENNVATLYVIQPDKTLKPVGSTPIGDGQSIEVVDGKIQIKGFGKGYYKYNAEVENHYEFKEGEFVAGLQPQIVSSEDGTGFEIAWFEPNPTTVEGLESQISSLSSSVNTLGGKVDTNITNISNLDTRVKAVEEAGYATEQWVEDKNYLTSHQDISGKADKTDLANYYTKTEADNQFMTEAEVDARVNKVITDAVDGDTLTSLTELVEYVNTHGGEAAEMATAITNLEQNKAEKADVYTKEEIEAKGYLTQHQDISGKADIDHTHSYNELTDLPEGLATQDYVSQEVSNQILSLNIDQYATKTELGEVQNQIPSLEGYARSEDVTLEINSAIQEVEAKIPVLPTDHVTQTELVEVLNNYVKTETLDSYASLEYANQLESSISQVSQKAEENSTAILEISNSYATQNYVNDQIAAAITGAEDGVLVQSVNEEQLEVVEGKLAIKQISTDLLVQGSQELILTGGNATGEINSEE